VLDRDRSRDRVGRAGGQALWSDWPGGTRACEAYAADVRAGFVRHVGSLRVAYGWERRWPSSPFWRRRR